MNAPNIIPIPKISLTRFSIHFGNIYVAITVIAYVRGIMQNINPIYSFPRSSYISLSASIGSNIMICM